MKFKGFTSSDEDDDKKTKDKAKNTPSKEDDDKDVLDFLDLKDPVMKIVREELKPDPDSDLKPGEPDSPVKRNIFQPNSKYFTIVMYALMFVLGAILIYKFIGNFGATVAVFKYAVKIVSPFLVGIFIALILYPLVHLFYKKLFMGACRIKSKKLAKILSIFLAYLLALGAIGVLMGFVIPQVYQSISDIIESAPSWYEKIAKWLDNYEKTHTNSIISYEFINNKLESALPQIIEYLTAILGNLVPYILNTSMAIVKGLINLIISIMVSVYMIADHKNIFYHFKRFLFATMPKKKAENARIICKNCANIFINFLLGKALDSLIIGIICFIVMLILKLPFAVLISVIVGVTNMIPYFGPYIGGVIGGVIIVIVNPMQVIIFAIMILVIQQFDGLFLGPKILGDSTGLRPLWVIFSITTGGYLFGVLGMFLGVPIFAVISYLVNISVQHFLDKKKVVVERYESEDDM